MDTFLYVFLAVTLIVMLVHCYIQNGTLEDVGFLEYLVDDGGFLVLLGLVVLGAIIFGFIFWNWMIMLIIFVPIILAFIGFAIWFIKKVNKEGAIEEEEEHRRKNYTENILTNYKCQNCGASLTKVKTVKNGKKSVVYNCEHCGVSYDQNVIKLDEKTEGAESSKELDLTDFEEEYFNSCYVLGIKPYNEVSETTLERKKTKKINQLLDEYDAEDEYDLEDESPEYAELIDSYDYLSEIEEELETYKEENDADEIKAKYDYYLKNYIKNDSTTKKTD